MSEDFDKDGILWKRIGSDPNKKRKFGQKKWNLVYVNLIGGSIHYYKDEDDIEPKGTIQLADLKLNKVDNQGSSSKKFCFSMKNDKLDYLFAAEEEAEWKSCVSAIEGNLGKPAAAPLKKEKRKSRAAQLAFKAKKNVIGKAATSAIGKKAIRSHAPEEVTNLIGDIKKIVEKESKSAKKAAEIEENMYKIGVKSYLLISQDAISFDALLAADKPLRAALEILSKCHDHAKFSRNPNHKALHDKFVEVNKQLTDAATILKDLLTPHLKPHNVARIKDTLDYLGDPDRLLRIFTDETINEELQELITSADHYTQFHFYSGDGKKEKGKGEA